MDDFSRINLTNYGDHPTNQLYVVYTFKKPEQADYFAELLEQNNIPYERATQEGEAGKPDIELFGVHKDHQKLSLRLNFLSEAKFRKPFMPNKPFRWVVVGVTIIAITIALISYLRNAEYLY